MLFLIIPESKMGSNDINKTTEFTLPTKVVAVRDKVLVTTPRIEITKDEAKAIVREDVSVYSDYQGVVWFLKSHERFSPIAFWDYKQATYGFGNKAKYVGQTIDIPTANSIFLKDINKRYNKLIRRYPNLNKDRLVALVLTNLVFNIGTIKEGSGLDKTIKRYDPSKPKTKKALCNKILQYNRAGGKKNRGLVKRRNNEVDLIMASAEERQKLYGKYRQQVVNELASHQIQ